MINESQIRERAYALWEKDYRPDDAAEFYWHLASARLNAEVIVMQPSNCHAHEKVQGSEIEQKASCLH